MLGIDVRIFSSTIFAILCASLTVRLPSTSISKSTKKYIPNFFSLTRCGLLTPSIFFIIVNIFSYKSWLSSPSISSVIVPKKIFTAEYIIHMPIKIASILSMIGKLK